MAHADATAVRVRGPPAFRRRAYRSLAYALAATAGPAGIVFESTGADPSPRASMRPRSVLATVRADPFGASGAFEEVAVPRAPEPPPGWVVRHFAMVPIGRPDRWTWNRPTSIEEAGGGAPDLPPDGWFGAQTFWVRRAEGGLAIARGVCVAAANAERLNEIESPAATHAATRWADATGVPARARRLRRAARLAWRRGGIGHLPRDAWLHRSPEGVAATAEALPCEAKGESPSEHRMVFGASGAGKTTYLAERASRAILAGEEVVAIDLHGDLAPAIVARLPAPVRARLIAVDASDAPVPGIAALAPASGDAERAAAQLVTALKRLTPDGTDVYWGFRLERIFDSFVRLVQESDGSLLDLYGLLTDPRRRESARWGTRREDLANFLDELGPVLKRNPEFLWSAATRLSKVVLVPALAELLAPHDGGLEVERLLERGRSLLVRLPIADLGPEAAAFAATLVLGRLYLGRIARGPAPAPNPPLRLVLDEVHGFPPRLVAEILTEGRKFGVRALVATQYPERLAPETRAAAAGALSACVAFRVPRATAAEVGAWLGLVPSEAVATLPHLATGRALAVDPELGRIVALPPVNSTPDAAPTDWSDAVERTRREFPGAVGPVGRPADDPPATERLLLAVLGAEEEGRALRPEGVVAAASSLPGEPIDVARLADRWPALVRRGWVSVAGTVARITSAGEEALGIGAPTGATRESGEHRALLLGTFRIFARHGARLEIVRQGRYDTTLPDARFRQLPPGALRSSPRELAGALERARAHWAWRYFGGRDVAVEAEVSGALRPDRIRRGWRKAEAHDAFALFVVGDARRARRVRDSLRTLGVAPDRARVWTLVTGTAPLPVLPTPPNP